MGWVLVRVREEQIEKLREIFPELRDEDKATAVRIALEKLIKMAGR